MDDVIKYYELCCVSPALFDKNGFMRTGDKSKLAEYLVKDSAKISYEDAKDLVKKVKQRLLWNMDGGALLQRVGWPK